MPNLITISGFTELSAKMRKLPELLQSRVDEAAKFAAGTWEQRAKQDAPTDQGRLKNEVKSVKRSIGNWQVVVNAEHAAWLEWGTKSKVRVPAGLASYAAQFKGRGTGKDAKRHIYEWCRRKGIPPEAWFPIYRSIMINGINPHPFFFIQRPIVEKQFLSDLRQVLNKID